VRNHRDRIFCFVSVWIVVRNCGLSAQLYELLLFLLLKVFKSSFEVDNVGAYKFLVSWNPIFEKTWTYGKFVC